MLSNNTRNYSKVKQYSLCIGLVLILAVVCFFVQEVISYRTVALLLLMMVSVLAMLFDILPVLTAAILSAVIWNYFFIPPLFTFHVDNSEDLLMFLLYFVIAFVHAVLTFKIRNEEAKVRDKEEKENSIRLYNTLFNSLSHELRTPISTIIGTVDTFKDNFEQLTQQRKIDLLNEIEIATMRLNRQVDNLLNISRLESGMLRLKIDWCDTNELVYRVIQSFQGQDKHAIFFTPNEHMPLLKFDAGLIEQVLLNLVHNAVHYTPDSSIINIDVHYQDSYCIIKVSDNGPGISLSEIPMLFDKFYRLPNSKAGGSGLGLSIVKGYVDAHGGRVGALQNEKGGMTFWIEFPVEVSYINRLKNE